MKKSLIAILILSVSILCGCGDKNGLPDDIIPIGVSVIKPIETVCDVDELYGNYNVDYDYSSFDGKTVTAIFYTPELYDADACKHIGPGKAFEFNDGNNKILVKTVENAKKPIIGTKLTDDVIRINNEMELEEGSNFYALSLIDSDITFFRKTGEKKTLKFSDNFVFYPDATGTLINDVNEAFSYLKEHPELNHATMDAAIDGETILAIRYLGEK